MTTVGWSAPVDGARTRSAVVALSAAVVVGLGVGVLTAYGQGWLSDAANSLANSAGPWSLALAGPPLGVAAAWSTGRDVRREVGFGVIGGVLIGEGIYGWTTVADTTDWRYWAVELALGVAIVLVAVVTGGRRPLAVMAGIGAAVATAAVVFAAGRLA